MWDRIKEMASPAERAARPDQSPSHIPTSYFVKAPPAHGSEFGPSAA